MSSQRANSLSSNASSSRGTTTTDCSLSSSQIDQVLSPSFDPQSIIADAKEIPPHNVEEAKCLLAIVRAEREVRRAEAQLADRLITKGHVWSEYRRLKAVEAWKKLGDAEMTVGQLRSVLSKSGFSCSELTLAVRRSKARSRHQQRVQFIPQLD